MSVPTATLPRASVPVVRFYIRQLRQQDRRERVIGIRAEPVWNGKPLFELDGAPVRVRTCTSSLAVREALVEHRRNGEGHLVVITDVDGDDLGPGLRARLAGQVLHPVKLWAVVQDAFRATDIDPLLTELKSWAPHALINDEPPTGWPAAPGGTLTRDFALGQLARVLLGRDAGGSHYVDGEYVDPIALLRWALDSAAIDHWLSLDSGVRNGLTGWLGQRAGPSGGWTLRAVSRRQDALACGLVAGLLWDSAVSGDRAATARGQLINRLGGDDPGQADALQWGRDAATFASNQLGTLRRPESQRSVLGREVHHSLARAEQLLIDFGMTRLIERSDQLPGSFVQRLRRFAATLSPATSLSGEALAAAEQAHQSVLAHDVAVADPRARTATMALRLLRWLATEDLPPDTLADTLDRQARDDAWVDRAFADVFTGDPDPDVAAGYQAVVSAVRQRRSGHDEQLARLLARATEDDPDLGRIISVEEALSRVVRPLVAAGRNVLLVVLDGMSAGVLTALGEELRGRRWGELVDYAVGGRQALLAALPTVTAASRTSLLTGQLAVGNQRVEEAGFAAAVGNTTARLFHKEELRAPAGTALSPDVRAAVADAARPVVGVVLNTIDDALEAMDPGGTQWTLDQVQHLGALSEVSRVAGRLLVLTADHGHVVERGSEYRRSTDAGGARWRPATSPAGEGEIVLRGRRVLLGEGDGVVAPWREDVRYGPKKAGYHGGASAAEVAVPFAVFDSGVGAAVGSWEPAAPPEPIWWLSASEPARPQQPGTTHRGTQASDADVTPTLFEAVDESARPGQGAAETSLVAAVFDSDVYAAQRARAGRAAPSDERVRTVVEALLAHGGRLHETALAHAAGIPAERARSVLAAVRRVLSVEGYETLRYDADGVMVVLDTELLRQQFGVGQR